MERNYVASILLIVVCSACYDFSLPKRATMSDSGLDGAAGFGQSTDFGSGNYPVGGNNEVVVPNGDRTAASGGASGGGPEACSTEGEMRCAAAAGQREQCSGGFWTSAEPCAQGEVCSKPSGAQAPQCQAVAEVCRGSAGKPVCDGEGTMYKCNAQGVAESTVKCSSIRLCESGTANGKCATCIPNEFRCTGVHLERCAEDGQSYEKVKDCENAALCKASLGECTEAACVADKYVCEGDVLQKCKADSVALETVKTCKAGLCDAKDGQCDICVPGTQSCDDAKTAIMTCNTSGQKYDKVACSGGTTHCVGAGKCVQCASDIDCPTPGNCKVKYCNLATGSCEPQVAPARTSCSGGLCDESGACVKCLRDSDCTSSSAKYCVKGECNACSPNGQNTCPLCKKCSAQGTCVNQSKGEDLNNDCPSSGQSSECANGSCNGSGACGVVAVNTACGTCQACDSAGTCAFVKSGSDPNSDCDPVSGQQSSSSSCKDGYCDGKGGCRTTTATKCYRDKDGDGYGDPTSYSNYCSSCPSTEWISNNKDCYDSNANAKPGETEYYEINRGDLSFDYNCDNKQEKKYPSFTNQTCASTCTSDGKCQPKSGAPATACGERNSECSPNNCSSAGASSCAAFVGWNAQACR